MSLEGRNPQERVNINTASTAELMERLDGVDSAAAQRIVDFRELHGPFGTVEALRDVPDVGVDVLDRNADRLTVEPLVQLSGVSAGTETRALSDREYEESYLEQTPPPADEPVVPVAPVVEEAAVAPTAIPAVEPGQPDTARVEAAPVQERAPTAAPGPRAAAPREPTPTFAQARRDGNHWWRSVLLVILGGLLGALLTLALIVLWSGTLSFAPRSQVDALSRNLNTVQANSELAWQRLLQAEASVGQLNAQVGQLNAQVGALQALDGRVARVQTDLQSARADLGQMTADLKSLRTETSGRMGALDERMGQNEARLKEFDVELTRAQATVQALDARMARFDTFFRSLRELLATLDQTAAPATSGSNVPGQAPTSQPTSTAQPAPSLAPSPTRAAP